MYGTAAKTREAGIAARLGKGNLFDIPHEEEVSGSNSELLHWDYGYDWWWVEKI